MSALQAAEQKIKSTLFQGEERETTTKVKFLSIVRDMNELHSVLRSLLICILAQFKTQNEMSFRTGKVQLKDENIFSNHPQVVNCLTESFCAAAIV